MERKGGCCLAPRYGAAAATAAQHQAGAAWQMGKIMLKFRPIAPKPAAMAPVPAPTPVAGPAAVGAAGRGKRKAAVCGGGGGRRGRKPKKAATTAAVVTAAPAPAPAAAAQDVGDCRKDCDEEKSSSSRSSSASGMTSVDSSPPPAPQQQHQHQLATLPLMPVTPPVEDKSAAGAATEELPAPVPSQAVAAPATESARPFAPRAMRPAPAAAASLVTVEEVTTTWRDGEAPPSSASCVVESGADDDAPAFVSDQWGRVTWRNAAFVRAVSADDDGNVAETTPVALSGVLPAWGTCAGFTCRVRVVRHSSPRRVGSSSSVVAPCDVWRLDAGGSYLWRLDLQAALTLGGRL